MAAALPHDPGLTLDALRAALPPELRGLPDDEIAFLREALTAPDAPVASAAPEDFERWWASVEARLDAE